MDEVYTSFRPTIIMNEQETRFLIAAMIRNRMVDSSMSDREIRKQIGLFIAVVLNSMVKALDMAPSYLASGFIEQCFEWKDVKERDSLGSEVSAIYEKINPTA